MAYKFKGIPIFKLSTFEVLCSNMMHLISNGYIESKKKTGLFYRKGTYDEIYFADMRGTDMVPIWSDPCPLFYANFPDAMPYWKRCRLASAEYKNLSICRVSCEFDSTEYSVNVPELGLYMSKGTDGYCEQCGIDFSGDGEFCSIKCADLFDDLHSPHCSICNKRLEYTQGDLHHTNYAEDIVMLVCRSCHLKIHRGVALKEYKPVDKPLKQTATVETSGD